MMNVQQSAAKTLRLPGVDEEVQKLDQTQKLLEQEHIIEAGLTNFEIGRALRSINEKELYTAKWKTFAAYCRERWDMSEKHAYRLIKTADVMDTLKEEKDLTVLPINEAQ